MISPGTPSITVPMTSSATFTSSMNVMGSLAMAWIEAATACGIFPYTSTHENTAAVATRNSTIAE